MKSCRASQGWPAEITVGLLTGGGDRHYAFGLAMALVSKGISVECVGGDAVDSPEMHSTRGLRFLNLRRANPGASLGSKAARILQYYVKLVRYAWNAKPRIFHILWNNKFEYFDRTVLMWYYKGLGKTVVLTAHNVNAGVRDSKDTVLNRLTLRIQYRLSDHIFVHTEQMRSELIRGFGIPDTRVSVIPYGINNAVPHTALTSDEAKRRAGIANGEKTLLFFGNIAPYKGVEYLIKAFEQLIAEGGDYRLVIAGEAKQGFPEYAAGIRRMVETSPARSRMIFKLEFVPDEEAELYFKAADVLVLPYTAIFQSGILFMGYAFGLPVIASDVGCLKADIQEGETGYICKALDSQALCEAICRYFGSRLYHDLENRRGEIYGRVQERHSWNHVGDMTRAVYSAILAGIEEH